MQSVAATFAAVAVVALAGALATSCSASPRSGRPDVLLISVDTLRADHLSLYGYERPTSPWLDGLARQAVRFDRAYAHSPFTLTSHMALLTSLPPHAHGVTPERALSRHIPTLAEILYEAGYYTVGFYAQDWLSPRFGFGRGFERYEHLAGGHASRAAVSSAVEEAEQRRPQPLFLFLHFRDVHSGRRLDAPGGPVYDAPLPYRDRFLPHPDLPIPGNRARDVWEGEVLLSPRELENLVARYDGGIAYVDDLLRVIAADLDARGLWSEALVIVTSDHGESLGDHASIAGHGGFYEEGLRVPLIVKLPASHPLRSAWQGVAFEQPVALIDLMPTILDISGLEQPETSRGRSLLDPAPRQIVASRGAHSVLIRGEHKLLRSSQPPGASRWQHYDLARDPRERTAGSELDSELLREMAAELERALADQEAFARRVREDEAGEVRLDAREQARLEALGYVAP